MTSILILIAATLIIYAVVRPYISNGEVHCPWCAYAFETETLNTGDFNWTITS